MDEHAQQQAFFKWPVCWKAEKIVKGLIGQAITANKTIGVFSEHLYEETGAALFDFVDYILVGGGAIAVNQLKQAGFVEEDIVSELRSTVVVRHPKAKLPRVLVDRHTGGSLSVLALVVRCDSLDFFRKVWQDRFSFLGGAGEVEGSLGGLYARCAFGPSEPVKFFAVERRGYRGLDPISLNDQQKRGIYQAELHWQYRKRLIYPWTTLNEGEAFEEAIGRARQMVKLVGAGLTSALVMERECSFWQMRNWAGKVQKKAQDGLGFGLANHDHYTFRSSRLNFYKLVRIFEILGFQLRERFHAGLEAGWGAQIMEQPESGLVAFLDIDLAPEEVEIDFAREPLQPLGKLGTIGLWCALYGESILQAGMHHLEIQCKFSKTRENLIRLGVEVMKPFSNLPFLKQAFTKGERWVVPASRLNYLLESGLITQDQFNIIFKQDAVGSHLEILERGGGYKGFNRKGVSEIIKSVDPRGGTVTHV